jgi:hypothetical protein
MEFKKITNKQNIIDGLIYDGSKEMKDFVLNWLPKHSRSSPYLEKYSVKTDGKRINKNEVTPYKDFLEIEEIWCRGYTCDRDTLLEVGDFVFQKEYEENVYLEVIRKNNLYKEYANITRDDKFYNSHINTKF